jgi:hypothetical protein
MEYLGCCAWLVCANDVLLLTDLRCLQWLSDVESAGTWLDVVRVHVVKAVTSRPLGISSSSKDHALNGYDVNMESGEVCTLHQSTDHCMCQWLTKVLSCVTRWERNTQIDSTM